VQKLIKIRLENEPLCSNATIEFLCAEAKTYPLVYKRTGKEGSVLIVLNPSNKEAVSKVTIETTSNEVIYSNNGVANIENDTIIAPPCSASIFKLA